MPLNIFINSLLGNSIVALIVTQVQQLWSSVQKPSRIRIHVCNSETNTINLRAFSSLDSISG